MPNLAWKQAERRAAALFGAKRRPLSGNTSGRERTVELGDDCQHERLYLEVKQGKQCNRFYSLYADTARKAASEKYPNGSRRNRTPVVLLQAKHQKGMLVVVHSSDLPLVLYEAARADPELLAKLADLFATAVMATDRTTDGGLDDIRSGDLAVKDRSARNNGPSAYGAARTRLPRHTKSKPTHATSNRRPRPKAKVARA